MTTEERLIENHGHVLVKKEVQEELRVSESTLDLMRKKGEIKFTKVGGSIRFSAREIARLIDGE